MKMKGTAIGIEETMIMVAVLVVGVILLAFHANLFQTANELVECTEETAQWKPYCWENKCVCCAIEVDYFFSNPFLDHDWIRERLDPVLYKWMHEDSCIDLIYERGEDRTWIEERENRCTPTDDDLIVLTFPFETQTLVGKKCFVPGEYVDTETPDCHCCRFRLNETTVLTQFEPYWKCVDKIGEFVDLDECLNININTEPKWLEDLRLSFPQGEPVCNPIEAIMRSQ